MDVWWRLLHQQGRKLQQQNAHSVGSAEGVVWVDDAVDENADDIVIIVLLWSWGSTN